MKKSTSVFLVVLALQTIFSSQGCCEKEPIVPSEMITNPLRIDGFGAQFQSIIFSVMYAELNNKKFLYTPFKGMEHNYNNDSNFLGEKEKLINFIGNFEVAENPNIQSPSIDQIYSFVENNLTLCAESHSLKKIKELFRLNKDKNDYFHNENLNVAIHIRRPNPHDSRVEGTDIPDIVYLRIIDFLRDTYSSKNLLFHIYSQGDISFFKRRFGSSDTVFHINESVEDTFSSMVFADVLVTSTSSLSYIAGFLSEGAVYYIPFWHPPLPSWKVLWKDVTLFQKG